MVDIIFFIMECCNLHVTQPLFFGKNFTGVFQVIDFTTIANLNLLLEVLQVRQYSNLSLKYNFANSGS